MVHITFLSIVRAIKIILDQRPHRAKDLKFSGSCFTAAYLEQ